MTGQLTVRGRTRPLTFPATVTVADCGDVWLDAEVLVNRADFGLTWNQMGMTSMQNTITVHAAFGKRWPGGIRPHHRPWVGLGQAIRA